MTAMPERPCASGRGRRAARRALPDGQLRGRAPRRGDLNGGLVDGPDWEQIKEHISRMDGYSGSFIQLDSPAGEIMWISGGNEGRYLVVYMRDVETQDSSTLVDNFLEGPPIEILSDGVAGKYPGRFGVGLPLALEAARYFHHTGRFPAHLTWADNWTGQLD